MAGGLLLIAVSLVLCFMMDLVFPPPELEAHQIVGSLNSLENNAKKMICILSNESSISNNESLFNNASSNLKSPCTIDPVRRNWAFVAWVLIYSIMGIKTTIIICCVISLTVAFLLFYFHFALAPGVGGTTVYVIGAPYLDDSISKKDSPFYFSMRFQQLFHEIIMK